MADHLPVAGRRREDGEACCGGGRGRWAPGSVCRALQEGACPGREMLSDYRHTGRGSNWREYEAGPRRRGSLTLWVTPEACPSGRHQDARPAAAAPIFRSGDRDRLDAGPGVWPAAAPGRRLAGIGAAMTGLALAVPDHTITAATVRSSLRRVRWYPGAGMWLFLALAAGNAAATVWRPFRA